MDSKPSVGFPNDQGQSVPTNDLAGDPQPFLYEVKQSLITETEKRYLDAIKSVLPAGVFLQAQVNLASIIVRTDHSKYQNELYRNIDACIFDTSYKPLVLIEINDSSHNDNKRKERDQKIRNICEEAGIPLITFWTSYGINPDYMRERVYKSLEQSRNPIRIAHHMAAAQLKTTDPYSMPPSPPTSVKKNGCYIATAVYGSYDCPNVWTLRRYRDSVLAVNWYGRLFIHLYYAISPYLVKCLGTKSWFNVFWKKRLDRMVQKLRSQGIDDSPYQDILD